MIAQNVTGGQNFWKQIRCLGDAIADDEEDRTGVVGPEAIKDDGSYVRMRAVIER